MSEGKSREGRSKATSTSRELTGLARQRLILAVLAMYEIEVGKHTPTEAVNDVILRWFYPERMDEEAGQEEHPVEDAEAEIRRCEEVRAWVTDVVLSLSRPQCLAEVDDTLGKHVQEWAVERLAKVDKNILRVATYLLRQGCEEARALIGSAANLAVEYGTGTDKSHGFVLAVLDAINRDLEKAQ